MGICKFDCFPLTTFANRQRKIGWSETLWAKLFFYFLLASIFIKDWWIFVSNYIKPMISRTGPCPCGSGKQYKRCCGKDSNGKGKDKNPFDSFNTIDLLKTISALTLLPENHGKNLRLEKLSHEAIAKFNTSSKKVKVDEFLEEKVTLGHFYNQHFPFGVFKPIC